MTTLRETRKLDIATDELIEETATRTLLSRYPDQVEAHLTVYTLEEIAEAKRAQHLQIAVSREDRTCD